MEVWSCMAIGIEIVASPCEERLAHRGVAIHLVSVGNGQGAGYILHHIAHALCIARFSVELSCRHRCILREHNARAYALARVVWHLCLLSVLRACSRLFSAFAASRWVRCSHSEGSLSRGPFLAAAAPLNIDLAGGDPWGAVSVNPVWRDPSDRVNRAVSPDRPEAAAGPGTCRTRIWGATSPRCPNFSG